MFDIINFITALETAVLHPKFFPVTPKWFPVELISSWKYFVFMNEYVLLFWKCFKILQGTANFFCFQKQKIGKPNFYAF